MRFIPTSSTAVEKLKRAAKKRRSLVPTSLAVALDTVALAEGYANWKHVTWCASQPQPAFSRDLSPELRAELSHQPVLEPEVLQSFASGLVFAVEMKEASETPYEDHDDIAECDDALLRACLDIWPLLIHQIQQEVGRDYTQDTSHEDVVQELMDLSEGYRFYRYAGSLSFDTFEDAWRAVFDRFYHPPWFVWLNGNFYDVHRLPEVLVDGFPRVRSVKHGDEYRTVFYRAP